MRLACEVDTDLEGALLHGCDLLVLYIGLTEMEMSSGTLVGIRGGDS
jgi:hypothetical protein